VTEDSSCVQRALQDKRYKFEVNIKESLLLGGLVSVVLLHENSDLLHENLVAVVGLHLIKLTGHLHPSERNASLSFINDSTDTNLGSLVHSLEDGLNAVCGIRMRATRMK